MPLEDRFEGATKDARLTKVRTDDLLDISVDRLDNGDVVPLEIAFVFDSNCCCCGNFLLSGDPMQLMCETTDGEVSRLRSCDVADFAVEIGDLDSDDDLFTDRRDAETLVNRRGDGLLEYILRSVDDEQVERRNRLIYVGGSIRGGDGIPSEPGGLGGNSSGG